MCLKTLEDETIMDDDEDDRRSVVSSSPSFYMAHQYRQSLEALPTSPFAASQVLRRAEEPFNLFSIAETKPRFGSDIDSRPLTPADGDTQGPWDVPVKRVAAPFRRIQDEESDTIAIEAATNASTGPLTTPAIENNVAFPTIDDHSQSSIQFPGGSPEQGNERSGIFRSRVESDTDILQTPFMRSRVQSRLQDLGLLAGEAGWRTRRESTAYVISCLKSHLC
jgi:1-phosphatidylinositol-3-phosphate 5-kinase